MGKRDPDMAAKDGRGRGRVSARPQLLCRAHRKHRFGSAGIGVSFYGYRHYDLEMGRWVSWDPIGERGGANLIAFVGNAPVAKTEFVGLIQVCCDSVRRPWPESMLRHCHIAESCAGMDAFDVWSDTSADRSMDNGKSCDCVTADDIRQCMVRHPYSSSPRGPHEHPWNWIDNNCQTSVILTLGNCCLRSTWQPNWYAGGERGRCTIYIYQEYGLPLCVAWELPDWRSPTPPGAPDPRLPPGGGGPDRPLMPQ